MKNIIQTVVGDRARVSVVDIQMCEGTTDIEVCKENLLRSIRKCIDHKH